MPYVWLGASGLLLAGSVIFSRKDPVALATFWVASGMIFTADYAVLDMFELYHYRPHLLPEIIPDMVLGVYLAELAFVGGFSVWLVYRLSPWAGTIIGTALVVGIELLFRRWRIFLGYQWQVWHTAVTFPPFFGLVYWFRAAAGRYGLARGWARTFVRLNLALWWSHFTGMVVYWILAGLVFRVTWLPTFARNQTLGAMLTVGPWVIAAMLWVMAATGRQRTQRLLWSAAGLLLLGQVWVSLGLWRFRAPWTLTLHTLVQVATIYITAVCDDWIERWVQPTERIRA